MHRQTQKLMVHVMLAVALMIGALCGSSTAHATLRLKAQASPWQCLVVQPQSEPLRLAVTDLQRYLGQVTGVIPQVLTPAQWREHPVPAVLLGSLKENALLQELSVPWDKLGEQGYYLANHNLLGQPIVLACGQGTEGTVNAVYGLLKELGYGFYLGSESRPARLPQALASSPLVRQPALKIRGVLPWYNFLNSPTTWDPVDHHAFADQLIRQGANFIGFHTYDAEPFGAYEENGVMKWGARLLNTSASLWSTTPTPAPQFAFGSNKLFAQDYFGAATTFAPAEPNAAIRKEQEVMREALDYAKKRGLHTCLGFEINDDPTKPEVREIFLKRLNAVLDHYPALDYVWLWQSETQGAQGFPEKYNLHILPYTLDPASPLAAYGQARREVFRRVVEEAKGEVPLFQPTEAGKRARAAEGARLEQFAQLARRALAQRHGAPKLVISGWGGDQRLISAEYYDGLDKVLPKDVIFASLDHINIRERVDAVYSQLPADRERWPIPWLECDGDEWQPQPGVHVSEKMMRYLIQGGSQGVLGIHWRTRDVEETFAYFVEAAWNPQISAQAFFQDLARRKYGPAIAAPMARIHGELDKLGYRWVGGQGQNECAPFTWGPGQPQKAEQLLALRDQAAALLPQAGADKPALEWLINCMNWTLSYSKSEHAAVAAEKLLSEARKAEGEKRRQLASQALQVMDAAPLSEAVQAYAKRVTTRGEYGVLATINTKAVVAWNKAQAEARSLAGAAPADAASAPWNPAPQVLLPRHYGTVPAGQELAIEAIRLGGGELWLHYRPLGQKRWRALPMQPAAGWVMRGAIPASAVQAPGVEFAFSYKKSFWQKFDFQPVAVTVQAPWTVQIQPPALRPAPAAQAALTLNVVTGKATPVELHWSDVPEADFFRVYRDEKPVVETAVTFFPDSPKASAQYRVEALRGGKVIARSLIVTSKAP